MVSRWFLVAAQAPETHDKNSEGNEWQGAGNIKTVDDKSFKRCFRLDHPVADKKCGNPGADGIAVAADQ